VLLPDVNVLVAAHRPDQDHHEVCRRWLTSTGVLPQEQLAVADHVLVSVIRVLTHRSIFTTPTSQADALSFVQSVRDAPRALRVVEGDLFFSTFVELCAATAATGKSIPDAALAALAIEHRAVVVTLDAGFVRFPRLLWMDPRDDEVRRNPERKR
jgi:uncharacterized protein